MEHDFSGYATAYDTKCSDGLTIRQGAFKEQDGQTVPLVWQHMHNEPQNVLGFAKLEHRADGDYAYCSFNDTESGKIAKQLVFHGDVKALSIYANRLVKKGEDVLHGMIREVSLVLGGANPGAFIDWVSFQHGSEIVESEADAIVSFWTGNTDIVTSGEAEAFKHSAITQSVESLEHAEPITEKEEPMPTEDKTVKDVFDTLNEEQKNVVYYMIGEALNAEDDTDDTDDIEQSDIYQEGDALMHTNVFETALPEQKNVLSHGDVEQIFADAKRTGSLREAVLAHAGTYGINDINLMFPDAKATSATPEFIARRMEWVAGVLNGVVHTPFSRIKTLQADLTPEEARAKGYVTGALKKDEVIGLIKRVTTPTTLYKKQKLDRDDEIDITDFDVVAWLKGEMRIMLDEEAARAILIGDGRDALSEDKVKDPAGASEGAGIRSIYKDHNLYAHNVALPYVAAATDEDKAKAQIEAIIRARKFYKGSGSPTFFTYADVVTEMLLVKNGNGDYMYKTIDELASKLRVSKIVEVEAMENTTRTVETKPRTLIGIIVNLRDYRVGATRGGEVSLFDDFDIDYNQKKFLLETRFSGALVAPKSALVIEQITA